MRYRIKIVPNNDCNADGEWREVEAAPDNSGPPHLWREAEKRFSTLIPSGFHMVSYESVEPTIGDRFAGLDIEGAS